MRGVYYGGERPERVGGQPHPPAFSERNQPGRRGGYQPMSTDGRVLRPRMVFDPEDPGGDVIETPMDHRMLWWLEGQLALAPSSMQDTYRALRAYLRDNCQHHWRDYSEKCCDEPDCPYPPHRQCLWCNDVVWLAAGSPQ